MEYCRIIGFSGRNGVGKTTIRNHIYELLDDFPDDFLLYELSFADKVKECAYKYFHWNGNKDDRGRRLLQYIGT